MRGGVGQRKGPVSSMGPAIFQPPLYQFPKPFFAVLLVRREGTKSNKAIVAELEEVIVFVPTEGMVVDAVEKIIGTVSGGGAVGIAHQLDNLLPGHAGSGQIDLASIGPHAASYDENTKNQKWFHGFSFSQTILCMKTI